MKTSTSKRLRWNVAIWLAAGLFMTSTAGMASGPIMPDPKAEARHQPQVEETANGIPLVNITAPSSGGVSRNEYETFNVPDKGAILNNSYTLSKTELAGYVQGNNNMAERPAKIIVNEVTGAGSTSMDGFLEVAGNRADVVIANPNGITVNGGGFINTGKAFLLTHEQYEQYLDDMKNAKTEEEKKRLQKDWEAIDERQRYSPISTPGTYWDLKTGRPFTVKEGGSLFEPVLVTATRAHGETIFESAMSSAINVKVTKYLGRETVIGDALTLPWDIAKDADINKYGIQGAKRRIGIDIYGNLMVVGTTVFTGGTFGGILKGLGVSIAIEEIKEYGAPSLTVQERENADNEYIEKINREMD